MSGGARSGWRRSRTSAPKSWPRVRWGKKKTGVECVLACLESHIKIVAECALASNKLVGVGCLLACLISHLIHGQGCFGGWMRSCDCLLACLFLFVWLSRRACPGEGGERGQLVCGHGERENGSMTAFKKKLRPPPPSRIGGDFRRPSTPTPPFPLFLSSPPSRSAH